MNDVLTQSSGHQFGSNRQIAQQIAVCRTFVYQRHVSRMKFADIFNDLRSKAWGETLYIFLRSIGTRGASTAVPAALYSSE